MNANSNAAEAKQPASADCVSRLVRLLPSRRFRCKMCGEKCRSSKQSRGKRDMCPAVNNDTNMNNSGTKASCRRMKDGWAAALEFSDGGWVIMPKRFANMSKAICYAQFAMDCLDDDEELAEKRPAPNQLIDLSNSADKTPKP